MAGFGTFWARLGLKLAGEGGSGVAEAVSEELLLRPGA